MNRMSNYTTRRTDRDVLAALVQFNEQGEGVAVRTIATQLEMCERTVRYSIRRLEQAGKVKVLEKKSKPNRYRVLQ